MLTQIRQKKKFKKKQRINDWHRLNCIINTLIVKEPLQKKFDSSSNNYHTMHNFTPRYIHQHFPGNNFRLKHMCLTVLQMFDTTSIWSTEGKELTVIKSESIVDVWLLAVFKSHHSVFFSCPIPWLPDKKGHTILSLMPKGS